MTQTYIPSSPLLVEKVLWILVEKALRILDLRMKKRRSICGKFEFLYFQIDGDG